MNDFLLDDEEEESNDIFGIADYYSPSAYSSLPPGASREDLVSSLQSEIASGSELMKEGKRLSLYEDDDLPGTKGSLAAASIFGLLPIALGAAFAGKKGALWGSNAGIAGAKPMLDRVTREQAKAQETGLGIFKEGAARRANAEKSIAALKKDEFKEEAANARSDLSFQRQKDLVDYRAARAPAKDEDSDQLTPEELQTRKSLMQDSYRQRYGDKVIQSDLDLIGSAKSAKDLKDLSKDLFLNIGEDRRGEGGGPSSVASTDLNIIEGAAKGAVALEPVISKLKSYEAKLGNTSAGGKFLISNLEQALPLTEAKILRQELDNVALAIITAAQGRGASDAETNQMKAFLAGTEALSLGELDQRLKRLHRANTVAARTRLESLKTDPKRGSQALKLEGLYGSTLPGLEEVNKLSLGVDDNAPTGRVDSIAARIEARRKSLGK
jgi:hypothetical protein